MKCCCPRKSRSSLNKYSPKAPTRRASSPSQICSPRPKSRRHRAARPPLGSGGGFRATPKRIKGMPEGHPMPWGWSCGYPWSMGWSLGDPRGMAVALVFQQYFEIFEFFCSEMMCQYVIGGQKTFVFLPWPDRRGSHISIRALPFANLI